jgi:hypothetical protein
MFMPINVSSAWDIMMFLPVLKHARLKSALSGMMSLMVWPLPQTVAKKVLPLSRIDLFSSLFSGGASPALSAIFFSRLEVSLIHF